MSSLTRAIRAGAVGEIRETGPGTVERSYRFPAEFPGFAGHFPGYPIVPAIVQLQAALCLAEDWLGAPLRLAAVENAKFLLQLRPQEEIMVECRERRRDGRLTCEARLRRGEEVAASFVLMLAAGEGEG